MDRVNGIDDETTHVGNETRWRREVLWGLARVLAGFRRANSVKHLKQAQGILAYADSFQSTIGKVSRGMHMDGDPIFNDDLTAYDFTHARQSVAASEALRSWQNSGNLQIIVGLLAITFSASSFWAALTRIARDACAANAEVKIRQCSEPVSNKAIEAAVLISAHPLVFLGSIIIPVAIFYSIFVKDIRTFRFGGQFAHFLSSLSLAIGSSVASKTSNSYLGYIVTTLVLVLMSALALLILIKTIGSMHLY